MWKDDLDIRYDFSRETRLFGIPGAGKTTTLSRMMAEDAKRYGGDSLLVSSFTNAAAKAILEKSIEAGVDVPDDNIGTLHSLCYHALGLEAGMVATGKVVQDFNDYTRGRWALTTTGDASDAEDVGALRGGGVGSPGDILLNRYMISRAQGAIETLWDSHELQAFSKDWTEWKIANNLVDFTDMIELALYEVPVAPGKPSRGFFDECQDFTPLELALARKWGAHMSGGYVIGGDDDQCIYAFSGAIADSFLNPALPDSQKVKLETSYRCPRAVRDIAVPLTGSLMAREDKAFRARDDDGSVRRLPVRTVGVMDALLFDIDVSLSKGKTCMILAGCTYMLQHVKTALRREGFPYHNPYAEKRKDWNPFSHPARGQVATWRKVALYLEGAETLTLQKLKAYADLLCADVMVRGAKVALQKEEDSTKPLNPADLLRWFKVEALPFILNPDLDWFSRNTVASSRVRTEYPVTVARRDVQALLCPNPKITLGTIHSVKGGEADVVYVFPDVSRAAMEDIRGEDVRLAKAAEDGLSRLFYVAVTRAREEVVLLDATFPGSAVRL
jgi:superfamily I DNA/RNA helicase